MEGGDEQPDRSITAPAIAFTMSGFDREEDAQQFAAILNGVIRTVSGYINVERLAGVSVAGDYAQALADIDRGVADLNPLIRSDNDSAVGVAMAVPVLRDGVLKKQLVFNADSVLPIWVCDPESEEYRTAIYMVAHECAHVADLLELDTAFPDTLLKERVRGFAALIEPHASSLWSEYTACRQSAAFGRGQDVAYSAVAVSAITDGQKSTTEAIAVYRFHGDMDRLVDEAFEPATRAVRTCAYLVGHLDAFGEEMSNELREALSGAGLLPLVEEMRDGLRALWKAKGEWKSRDDFAFMSTIIRDAIGVAGMVISDGPDGGAYIAVPFTSMNP